MDSNCETKMQKIPLLIIDKHGGATVVLVVVQQWLEAQRW